jgi:hypothetical protein
LPIFIAGGTYSEERKKEKKKGMNQENQDVFYLHTMPQIWAAFDNEIKKNNMGMCYPVSPFSNGGLSNFIRIP